MVLNENSTEYKYLLSESIKAFSLYHDIEKMRIFCFESLDGEYANYTRLMIAKMGEKESSDMEALIGNRYLWGIGLSENSAKGIAMLNSAADKGSTYGHYCLGRYWYSKAEYLRSQEQFEYCIKNPDILDEEELIVCYSNLAWIYWTQYDSKMSQAVELFTIAADKYHDPYSCWWIARYYGNEESHVYNPQKEFFYLEQGVKFADGLEKGNYKLYGGELAAAELAKEYIFGNEEINLEPNIKKAREILKQYENSEDPYTNFSIGMAYYYSQNEVNSDYQKAICHLLKRYDDPDCKDGGMATGYLGASYALCNDYKNADRYLSEAELEHNYDFVELHGVVCDEMKNYQMAALCFDKAIELDIISIDALFDYEKILTERISGNINYRRAWEVAEYGLKKYNDIYFAFIQSKLVLQGNIKGYMSEISAAQMLEACANYSNYAIDAYMILADYYYNNKQYANAERNYLAAFDKGYAEAGVKLGYLYENGGGSISPDSTKAYSWFVKAANAGSTRGKLEADCFRQGFFGGYKRYRRS